MTMSFLHTQNSTYVTLPFRERWRWIIAPEETINRIANSHITHEDYYHTTCNLCEAIQSISNKILDDTGTIRRDIERNRVSNVYLCDSLDAISAQIHAIATAISDRTRNDEVFEMIGVFFDYKQSKKQKPWAKEIKISPYTLALLECINSLNKHSEQVYKALSDYFDNKAAENLMNSKYYPAFETLKENLNDFLMVSITANIDEIDFEEI